MRRLLATFYYFNKRLHKTLLQINSEKFYLKNLKYKNFKNKILFKNFTFNKFKNKIKIKFLRSYFKKLRKPFSQALYFSRYYKNYVKNYVIH